MRSISAGEQAVFANMRYQKRGARLHMTNCAESCSGDNPPKFSDLNTYLQGLQTRVSICIAVLAFLLAAISSLRDSLSPPDGAPNILSAVALVCLGLGFLPAAGTLRTPVRLTLLLEDRLGSRNLTHPDYVGPELHAEFLQVIRLRHRVLSHVSGLTFASIMYYIGHYLAIFSTDGKTNIPAELCIDYIFIDTSQLSNLACTYVHWSFLCGSLVTGMFIILSLLMYIKRIRARQYVRRIGNAGGSNVMLTPEPPAT